MARRRAIPSPRSRPHRFRTDRTDHNGHFICVCGSLDTDAVHRPLDLPPRLDVAALAAGDRPEGTDP